MKRFYLLILSVSMLLVFAACAAGGEIAVSGAWARPAAAGQNSAVYFELENGSSAADRLVGVSGDAAKMIQAHETMIDANNVASMHHMPEISIPAGEVVVFEPGGLHVMMMNLSTDLNPGDVVTITLHFEKHADIVVEAPVREP